VERLSSKKLLHSALCMRGLAMGFHLSKARFDGQFPIARLSEPKGTTPSRGADFSKFDVSASLSKPCVFSPFLRGADFLIYAQGLKGRFGSKAAVLPMKRRDAIGVSSAFQAARDAINHRYAARLSRSSTPELGRPKCRRLCSMTNGNRPRGSNNRGFAAITPLPAA
jgi:hypothetical protein